QRRSAAHPQAVPAVLHRSGNPARWSRLLHHVRRTECWLDPLRCGAGDRAAGGQRDQGHRGLRRFPQGRRPIRSVQMNVWSKLLTALRGGANEVGEALVDGQALRILDQEIRDADVELRKSKEALAAIMAKQKLAAERTEKGAVRVAEYEQYALKALESGDENLAREVAVKIANLESELSTEREHANGYAASVAQLRAAVTQAEG